MQEVMITAKVTVSYPQQARPEEILTTRINSRCHFFPEFNAGKYRVQLRLDWNDPDSNGNPTLDADIYNRVTGKKISSRPAKRVHHTHSESGDMIEYIWQFEDIDLHMRIEVAWEVGVFDPVGVSEKTQVAISPPQVEGTSENS